MGEIFCDLYVQCDYMQGSDFSINFLKSVWKVGIVILIGLHKYLFYSN